jgi:hypothetical protein
MEQMMQAMLMGGGDEDDDYFDEIEKMMGMGGTSNGGMGMRGME